jgi:TATA-box binding protein (TBP) (component of TFIID and TFIIIB)
LIVHARAKLGQPLDLGLITRNYPEVEYDKHFGTLKLDIGESTCMITPNGGLVSVAGLVAEASKVIREVVGRLREVGIRVVRVPRVLIDNIIEETRIAGPARLDNIPKALAHSIYVDKRGRKVKALYNDGQIVRPLTELPKIERAIEDIRKVEFREGTYSNYLRAGEPPGSFVVCRIPDSKSRVFLFESGEATFDGATSEEELQRSISLFFEFLDGNGFLKGNR